MLPAAEAEQLILSLTQPLDARLAAETVALDSAFGRILATTVTSQLDFPHWDNSAMDGYAVRYEDVQQVPTALRVVEEIPAGQPPQQPVTAGQAARIFTGGMLPAGADTIVMQEDTERSGDQVKILSAPQPQAFVRHRGAFYQAGDALLPPGIVINAPELAVLAAAQCTQVSVYRRPRVALLSTGNELVSPDRPLQPGQIVDSNQVALAALVAQSGAIPLRMGIVPDRPEALKAAIASAFDQADLVISTGGVSVGDYDYVDRILGELGAQLHIRSVAVKPGKPLTVAAAAEALYFGLPGNPVSALVGFWRFVQPALRKLSGQSDGWGPPMVTAITEADLKAGGRRETYLWGQLHLSESGYRFQLAAGSHSSGNLVNLRGTSGLAVVPIGSTTLAAGSSIRVLSLL
ncbi:MAG: molybdopterin molybdotransferase MoeA [Leptolyngbya sp. SIO4C1]|nr:molybdopterin molybdotransferase MoeA [Leptolyngbya sp. SIO4C1]